MMGIKKEDFSRFVPHMVMKIEFISVNRDEKNNPRLKTLHEHHTLRAVGRKYIYLLVPYVNRNEKLSKRPPFASSRSLFATTPHSSRQN